MSKKCPPGCACKRHGCPPDCTCAKHKAYYRGGSKKGKTFSPEARQRMSEAAKRRKRTPEERQRLSDEMKARHADPEYEAKRIEALRKAQHACPPGCDCGRHSPELRRRISEAAKARGPLSEEHKEKIAAGLARARTEGRVDDKISEHELVLSPYLERQGYQHNHDMRVVIGRKVPDFVDEENKRVFEYFGAYWHERGDDEVVIEYYANRGWTCEVLWEYDVLAWLAEHRHLVNDEYHQTVCRVAKAWLAQSKRHMS